MSNAPETTRSALARIRELEAALTAKDEAHLAEINEMWGRVSQYRGEAEREWARAEKAEAERDAAVKALEPFAIQAERILKGCVRADGSSWVGDDSSWHLLLSLNTHPNEIITGADLRRAAALPKLKTETASG